MDDLENLRCRFRPEWITTLFVGESPPQGGTFFYKGDSLLYRQMKGSRKEFWVDGTDFLQKFKDMGFFLDDLVLFPINKKEEKERERLRWEGVESLAQRMDQSQPRAIMVVMCASEPMVRRAANRAELDIPIYVTAFPSRPEHQHRFRKDMREFIPNLPMMNDSESQ
jgi:hypothetical protein